MSTTNIEIRTAEVEQALPVVAREALAMAGEAIEKGTYYLRNLATKLNYIEIRKRVNEGRLDAETCLGVLWLEHRRSALQKLPLPSIRMAMQELSDHYDAEI